MNTNTNANACENGSVKVDGTCRATGGGGRGASALARVRRAAEAGGACGFARLVACAAVAFSASLAAYPGTSYLGGNAVLEQLTRVEVKSSSAESVSFSAVDNAAVGVLDWSKFNIGNGQSMGFNGAGTTFFNLVDGAAGSSTIDGIINGNGSVWVINPAGIAFGANASVNVDGLFAAAAGAIGNADALRDGTASLPVFDSFGGTVDATKGAFVANQVALLGQKVNVGGEADFSGAFKVDVGAGDNLVVDDVGGGMVSVDVSDFSATEEEVVDISGLTAPNVVVDVVANGSARVAGDVVAGRLQVAAASDLTFDAEVTTTMAGLSAASLDRGSVTVAGSVDAAGDVTVVAANGTVDTGKAAIVAAGEVMMTAKNEMTVGDVTSRNGSVELSNEGGDLVIDGSVTTQAAEGEVLVKSATDATRKGSIIINGELSAKKEGAGIVAIAGYGALKEHGEVENTPNQPLLLGRRLTADPITLSLVQVHGQGEVIGRAYITLRGENGVYSEGTIDARSATLEVYGHEGAGEGSGKRGVIDLYERVIEEDSHEEVAAGRVLADFLYAKGDGDVYIDNPKSEGGNEIHHFEADVGEHVFKIETGNPEGDVEIGDIVAAEFYHMTAGGTIRVVGDIMAPDMVMLETVNGDIVILDGCTVTATGDDSVISLSAGGFHKVEIQGALDADAEVSIIAGGDVEIGTDAQVVTHRADSTVSVEAGRDVQIDNALSAGSAVTVNAERDVAIRSGLSAGTSVSVEAGRTLKTGGEVSAGDNVKLVANGGDVEVGSDVTAGSVSVGSAEGSVKVATGVRVAATAGGLDVVAGKDVAAGKDSTLRADGGDVTVGAVAGKVQVAAVEAQGGNVELNAEAGAVQVAGNVKGENVSMIAGDEVEVEGKVAAEALALMEAGGDVRIARDVTAANVSLDAAGEVSVEKDAKIDATAGGVGVSAGRDAKLEGAIGAKGDVGVSAGRDAKLEGAIEAEGGVVLVDAAGDIVVSESVRSDTMREIQTSDGSLRPVSVNLESTGGKVVVKKGATVETTHEKGTVVLNSHERSSARGGVSVEGKVKAAGKDGAISINTTAGELALKGTVDSAGKTYLTGSSDGMTIGGTMRSSDALELTTTGNLTVNGTIASGDGVYVSTESGNVTVNGRIDGGKAAMVSTDAGSVRINGTVAATDRGGSVLVQSKTGGSVSFGASGKAVADSSVIVKVGNGNLTQDGGATVERGGYVEPQSVRASIVADQALLDVNGSIGSSYGGYFGVAGKMYVFATGNASLAAADGQPLRGGTHYEDVLAQFGGRVSMDSASSEWANNTIKANGDLSVYTSSYIEPNGLFYAGRNLSVSAASYGNMSYLQAGGTLRVNNVGHPDHPQIAFFESVNGREPRIDDQANDALVFVDGRLAGGNLQTISKMGAMEAFPVSTPELKSEQGIFGNPVFLHGDLDVAVPMAVGCVDYLIQEIPRLLLSGEFPLGVDRNVLASGLNPRDIYRFGQRSLAERKEVRTLEDVQPEKGEEATRQPEEETEPDDDRVVTR